MFVDPARNPRKILLLAVKQNKITMLSSLQSFFSIRFPVPLCKRESPKDMFVVLGKSLWGNYGPDPHRYSGRMSIATLGQEVCFLLDWLVKILVKNK